MCRRQQKIGMDQGCSTFVKGCCDLAVVESCRREGLKGCHKGELLNILCLIAICNCGEENGIICRVFEDGVDKVLVFSYGRCMDLCHCKRKRCLDGSNDGCSICNVLYLQWLKGYEYRFVIYSFVYLLISKIKWEIKRLDSTN